jgi:hypothetical protein
LAQSKQALLDLLRTVDKLVPAELTMTLVGAGDTAMALLDLKPPSVHLDFTGSDKDVSEFGRICHTIPTQGFQIHTWNNGLVFGNQLPSDYMKLSLPLSADLARMDLRALHPLDIVVSRIERLTDSDMHDIKTCVKVFKLGKNQISKRARALQLVRDESKFERNLDHVLSLFV